MNSYILRIEYIFNELKTPEMKKKNTFHTQHERISVHSHTYTFRPTNTCVHRDVSVWPQRCECVGAARAHQHTQTEHLRTPTRQNPHTRTGSYVYAWRRRRRKCRWIKNDLAANFDVLSRFIHSESYRGRNGRIGGFFFKSESSGFKSWASRPL